MEAQRWRSLDLDERYRGNQKIIILSFKSSKSNGNKSCNLVVIKSIDRLNLEYCKVVVGPSSKELGAHECIGSI